MLKKLGGAATFVASLFLTGYISQDARNEMSKLEQYLTKVRKVEKELTTPKKTPPIQQTKDYSYLRTFSEVNNTNFERSKKFYDTGFSVLDSVYFAGEEIPLEYALFRKNTLKCERIIDAYSSPFRDNPISKKTTRETYQENITYHNFNKLQIPESKEKLPIPLDLTRFFIESYNLPKIKNPKRFRKQVLQEAKKLGKSLEDISTMSPKDSIKLAVDIVSQKMTWTDVDPHLGAFAIKHGIGLPHDKYFELGQGDCDKYARITQAIHEIFKKENQALKNIYLTSGSELGGRDIKHEWNSILVLTKDGILISHIDPVFYDSPKKALEVSTNLLDKKRHLNLRSFREDFYYELENSRHNKTQPKTNQPNQKAINRKQPKLPTPNNFKKQLQKNQTQYQSHKKANYQTPRKVKVPQLKKGRSNNKRNK
jgi:hypothetical protein